MMRPWSIRITVEGLNIARFIRRAGEADIPLSAVAHPTGRILTARIREDDLPALRAIAEQGGWSLTSGNRVGAGHWWDVLRTRWLMCIAVVAAFLLLMCATRIIWRIEVVDGGAYAVDIRAALTELGVTTPAWRSRIDLGALRDALEWRYPRIAWVECGFRGITLVIRPVEGVQPVRAGESGPCDIVASRDGVIHHIVTRAGTPVVSIGDVVRAGDVLIRGEERTAEGAVRPVAARGSVTARVWMGATVRMSAMEATTAYTGREDVAWTIRTPFFDLWQLSDCPYQQADTAIMEIPLIGLFMPVTLHIERRMEAEYTTALRDIDEVKADAAAAARRKLHEKLAPKESLIDIWGNCSMIDDENVSADAIGEMLVEIGMRSPGTAPPEGPVSP